MWPVAIHFSSVMPTNVPAPKPSPQPNMLIGVSTYLNAREMAKIGLLYLHDGSWDGKRILPEGWVQRSWTPQPLEGLPSGELSYGLGWWIADYGGHDAFFAAGHGGQTITVVPDLDLVVVIAANPQSPGEWQRFRRVIPDHVVPAITEP